MVYYFLVSLSLLCQLSDAFYAPLASSSSVTQVAKSIKLEGSTVVISRNSIGHPLAFHDYCPHRGSSFDKVTIKEDKIACKYHGFEFDANDGYLTRGLGVKKGCSSLRMIECVEQGGIIWACIEGDDTIKPPSELVQASDPSFRKITGSVIIKCPVNRLIENVIDPYHPSYVHSFGNKLDPEPKNYKAKRVSPTEGFASFEYSAGDNSMFNGNLNVDNWFSGPFTAGTLVRSGNDVKVVQVNAVQMANSRTKVFWELHRNWLTNPAFDSLFSFFMKMTLDEDKYILEKCNFDSVDKFHSRYDKLQILFKKSFPTES